MRRYEKRMNRCLIPGIAALALCAPLAAQETRGSIRGTVRSGERPVADARITIVHLPSGTITRGRTGGSGAFVADGLRVGGRHGGEGKQEEQNAHGSAAAGVCE